MIAESAWRCVCEDTSYWTKRHSQDHNCSFQYPFIQREEMSSRAIHRGAMVSSNCGNSLLARSTLGMKQPMGSAGFGESLYQFVALSAIFLVTAQSWAQSAGGQPYGQPSTAKGDWPMYFADPSGSRYSPAGPDQRLQLQQAGGGLAFQDRRAGRPSGIQAGRHAAGR